jgi:putative nucleotidyltransferase with HDIG domain
VLKIYVRKIVDYFSHKLTHKIALTIGLVITLIIFLIFSWLTIRQNGQIKKQVEKQARILFTQILLTRQWVADYHGVYVRKRPGVETNRYLVNPDIETVDKKIYTLRNPALVTRELSKYSEKANLYRFHITSLKLINPDNKPDSFEKSALKKFETGTKEVMRIERQNGQVVFRYMAPLYVNKSCLSWDCHGRQGYKVGDVRGGISIFIPVASVWQAMSANRLVMLISGVSFVLTTCLVIFALLQRLVLRPVADLTKGAIELSRGNFDYSLSEERRDEFGILARTFNKASCEIKAKQEDLVQLFTSTIRALAAAVDAKSPWTAGHSERVARIAVNIGQKMKLSTSQLEKLKVASLLHDIGKISTPEEILDYPGRLTNKMYQKIKEHTIRGAQIIQGIKQLEEVKPALRNHHERFDGRGYPDRLVNNNIPLFARIIAVADAYDAMVTERPYRKGISREKAAQRLKEGAGVEWDAQVVAAFLKTLPEE